MVYEAAALGLSLKIRKCSNFPRYAMIVLGTIVDLKHFQFRVSRKRTVKIKAVIKALTEAAKSCPSVILAKLVAGIFCWANMVHCTMLPKSSERHDPRNSCGAVIRHQGDHEKGNDVHKALADYVMERHRAMVTGGPLQT